MVTDCRIVGKPTWPKPQNLLCIQPPIFFEVRNIKKNIKDGLLIAFVAVVIATIVSLLSNILTSKSGAVGIMILVLLFVIILGIVADALGTAAAAADLKPINALAAKKEVGAKEAVIIVKKADKFANIAQDVIGDVLNTLSGVFGVGIVLAITTNEELQNTYTLVITGLIVAITVFGKAIGKTYAIKNANKLMIICGRIIHIFRQIVGKENVRKN